MNRQVGQQTKVHRNGRPFPFFLAFMLSTLLCAMLWLAASPIALAQNTYNYTVQEGESWDTVAVRTGVAVADLRAANPDAAARESGWLLVGETLVIPLPVAPPQVHKVLAGESWHSIATKYNVSVALLRALNPQAVRSGNVLYRGDELIIPTAGSVPPAQPTSTATATPSVVASATVTTEETIDAAESMTATVTATATLTVEAGTEVTTTSAMTASATMTASSTMTDSADSTSELLEFDLPACPDRFADYPQTMTELINSAEPNGLAAVLAFLDGCDALVDDGVEIADLNGDDSDDLVVVYQNPNEDQIFVEGDLVIFNSTAAGYVLAYRARAAGEVRLLTVDDINLDELTDVVWVDTTCGASTCFDTVNVRSWDGSTWADWTEGTITMAYAEIVLSDVSEAGLGEEIALEGGIYGSVGAGPQRSRSEIWASVDGKPYKQIEKSYSQTECLYHTVLDANRALLDAPMNGFEAATALYTQAVENTGLIKCWVRNDEMAELRSFSLFRLALIAGYADDVVGATAHIDELTAQYPGSIYDEVGQLWLESYTTSEDAALACEDVLAFAGEDSAAWEMLADYGYTNPSFEAIDVCPILVLSVDDEEDATE